MKKSTETVVSTKGENLLMPRKHIFIKPKTEKTNEMEESPKIEAARSENYIEHTILYRSENEGNKTL